MLDNIFQAKLHVRMDKQEGKAAIEFHGQSSAEFYITLIVDGDATRSYSFRGNDDTNLFRTYDVHNAHRGLYLVDEDGFCRGIRVDNQDILIVLARVEGEVVGSALYEVRCGKYLRDRFTVLLPLHVNNILIGVEYGFPIQLPEERSI